MEKKRPTNKNAAINKFLVDSLDQEQELFLQKIEKTIKEGLKHKQQRLVLLEGPAGTGKSVLLTELFSRIKTNANNPASPYYQKKSLFTVNHPELLKVYQEMTAYNVGIKKKDYQRPTSIINRFYKDQEKTDILLIDEGHLLLSKKEPYIRFNQDNQLEELLKLSQVVVLVFDFNQVIQSKMFWDEKLLAKITNDVNTTKISLATQYRMHSPKEVLHWIDNLLSGTILPSPKINESEYDFQIFDSAKVMYDKIKQRNDEVGLSRILATTGFVKQSEDEHNVYMDDFNLPWDEYDPQTTPWAEREESINEVGSIYTIQGFDLNYAGVILGPPFEYDDQTQKVVVNAEKVTHREIYKKSPLLTDDKQIAAFQAKVMFNALNILLKRGTKGLYITAANDHLREVLVKSQSKRD